MRLPNDLTPRLRELGADRLLSVGSAVQDHYAEKHKQKTSFRGDTHVLVKSGNSYYQIAWMLKWCGK